MSYNGLTFAELSDRFSSLRQAPLGDRRAPHKPLLILLMLGRYQRGNFQSLLFEEAQDQLKELLFEFGPPSRSINVLDPFWRLQNDGIWRVEDHSGLGTATAQYYRFKLDFFGGHPIRLLYVQREDPNRLLHIDTHKRISFVQLSEQDFADVAEQDVDSLFAVDFLVAVHRDHDGRVKLWVVNRR